VREQSEKRKREMGAEEEAVHRFKLRPVTSDRLAAGPPVLPHDPVRLKHMWRHVTSSARVSSMSHVSAHGVTPSRANQTDATQKG
jgi:hypothetical protein